ncbi:LamB/YcsF family protein [Alteromonas pelagimontana]|uniref:LamB/YcsF family protein n=1 Tax=Alteromonas pelagimontana TaxID=1858656 RepID=A0A6M4M8F8_9ALTE|nr:5-oxoprolinase subunit PxpA [Alteromonas pelagimontana]QJR79427.1 LamB/YcsF family protein [Alteromonas pelagimontana]
MMLNCDLGESYGAWKMPVDERIMAYIDQANIACGFHAGDPLAIQQAIASAKRHGVAIGAHPAYPDLQGFGRRSMKMEREEIIACLHYQVAALAGMAKCQGVAVRYIKPHGALYNDLMKDTALRQAVMQAVAHFEKGALPLMIQAHPAAGEFIHEAEQLGITLLFEAFADRLYSDEGFLVSRHQEGAVLDAEASFEQVNELLDSGKITTESGRRLTIKVDSICVHGDSPDAIAMAQQVREELDKRGLSANQAVPS